MALVYLVNKPQSFKLGTHFINDGICYLIDHFILKHISSIVYYPQGNGQTKSTNKVFCTLFTKLMNENRKD
jgi:hypothetical protein